MVRKNAMRVGWTVMAALFLAVFPLWQGGTYSHITLDKWHGMQILAGAALVIGLAAFFHPQSCIHALFDDLLQGAQRIQRAREAGVGIKVRKRLFGFAHGQSLFKSFVQGGFQPVDISLCLVGRKGRERLLFLSQCHIILCK